MMKNKGFYETNKGDAQIMIYKFWMIQWSNNMEKTYLRPKQN